MGFVKEYSSAERDALLAKWKDWLCLGDWEIKLIADCLPDEILTADATGEVEYTFVNRSAIIRIIKPEVYGERLRPFDFEKTLVHELLHLRFAVIDTDDEVRDRVQHQLIDDLAKAMVYANRERMRGCCEKEGHGA